MIRIAVYNSNSLVLAGLVSILDRQPNLQIIGSFVDEASLLSLSDRAFDLLLLERMPDKDFWWLERWMLAVDFEVVGILLTDSLTVEELGEYLDLGFKAFLPRLTNADEIIAAIATVRAGLIAIAPELASFAEHNVAITPLPALETNLTSREMEVLQLLGTGLDNRAIASALQISKHTVKFHISSILSKLCVSSRTEAVTLGLRQGLIRL
ncbi:response regulator transcription factor [Myxosarcina sp. GI1]|uniref:response regulator transcription factor n=1 Tax=Myxosarcina sp. GI1 TaxID=1541065 RepID=UPI000564FC73|nr:response regulator transcription factor [Myxosarcina sp. GI1]